MSTRGMIGILEKDGTVKAVYSHWDNYLEHVGRIIFKNYQDENKIRKLISLGDISSLREEVDIPQGVIHNFENAQKNITVFYGRDRGEKDINFKTYKSKDEYKDVIKNGLIEFVYLYNDGVWYYSTGNEFNNLQDDLKKKNLI